MSLLEVRALTHVYAQGTAYEHRALDRVSFTLEEGGFTGLIGHTGSGKSTLVQHLNGLMKPAEGQVLLDGEDIWARQGGIRGVRFLVGLVFQYPEYQLFEETVYKDIAFGPTNMGLSAQEVDRNVRQAAALVGIGEELLGRSPFELSGGQKRRVAIAGVMAMRPSVLILDEPTAGLDPQGREDILGQVQQYRLQEGATVLLVSHSMEDVARHADRILVMDHGRLVENGPVEEVFGFDSRLGDIGLAVPQVTSIFRQLHRRGHAVSPVFTVEAAIAQIEGLLEGGGIG
ncbi:MAG: energy-coupling factor transporter ATPase [Clostridiales bacterium]|nr:energy-coupling factor transporter ATPase [Clostridiales bacterium]